MKNVKQFTALVEKCTPPPHGALSAGGWFLGGVGEIRSGAQTIADVYGDDDTADAAAQLMAAAPELLAACEMALKGHGRVHEDWCALGPDNDRCTCHVRLLEEAVKKARGSR